MDSPRVPRWLGWRPVPEFTRVFPHLIAEEDADYLYVQCPRCGFRTIYQARAVNVDLALADWRCHICRPS